MQRLKNDLQVSNPPVLMSELVSRTTNNRKSVWPFAKFFKDNPILVPIPNSSWMYDVETLWVPQRIAKALIRNGLGKASIECLRRVLPLPKSATSLAKDRPKAFQHYDSLDVRDLISEPQEILLIDDVITRGATILGAASRLKQRFPTARIRAFSVIRTMSPPDVFSSILHPCEGVITLNGQDTFRRP